MYNLPDELIAKYPPTKRGTTRLLVYDRKNKIITHKKYSDVIKYIQPDDVIVLNKTKVQNVRTFPTVQRSGKQVELLFLENIQYQEVSGLALQPQKKSKTEIPRSTPQPAKEELQIVDNSKEYWYCLIGRAKKVQIGDILVYPNGIEVKVIDRKKGEAGFIIGCPNGGTSEIFKKYGHVPLPPYMKRPDEPEDNLRYNTVFAKNLGSVAAPTASLNLTEELLAEIENKGAKIAYIELKIGWGTFAPIDITKPEKVKLHPEYYNISQESAEIINNCKGAIWAFGTTVTRVLETVAVNRKVQAGEGFTEIFIYPGYKWKIVDHLVTNFHMPNSSLILLVASLIGEDEVKRVYNEAIIKKYKFLSYGDSMVIV